MARKVSRALSGQQGYAVDVCLLWIISIMIFVIPLFLIGHFMILLIRLLVFKAVQHNWLND